MTILTLLGNILKNLNILFYEKVLQVFRIMVLCFLFMVMAAKD